MVSFSGQARAIQVKVGIRISFSLQATHVIIGASIELMNGKSKRLGWRKKAMQNPGQLCGFQYNMHLLKRVWEKSFW